MRREYKSKGHGTLFTFWGPGTSRTDEVNT